MTNLTYAQHAYMSTGIQNMSPLDLVIKLYDGAINFLGKAAVAVNNQNRMAKIEYINKTRAIIEELLSALKVDEGVEVAQNLQDLYTYMLIELARATTAQTADKVLHIQELLKTLRSAWHEVRMTVPQSELSPAKSYAKVN